ncbi:MAG: hypothetical protein LBP85_09775 [Prevotellaceae bacterium]|jgi:hypothetical protein|nr:hypothetical protein [Prevotellaceae bacterium]
MKGFIALFALIIISGKVFAQTETQKSLKNSTLNNSDVLPQNTVKNRINNSYPLKLTLEADLYGNEKIGNDSVNPNLLFVRSAFYESSQIFKKINPDYAKGMPLKITEDFGAYIDTEYRFNMFTLKWETMPKSDIATVIKWLKRIFKKQ